MVTHDASEQSFTNVPTAKGIRECAKVMCELLKLGWQKSDLDYLDALFWSVRDKNGNVKHGNKT